MTVMFASIQLLTVCLSANPISTAEFEGMGYLSVLTNPQSSKPQVQEALKKLKEKSISPSVWIRILDDSRFSFWHRDRALIELIQRNVQPQMTLGELRDLFRESKVLKKCKGCQLGRDLYVLSAFDEEGARAIYVGLERSTIVADQLLAVISGKEVDESILEKRILDITLGHSGLLDK
jgi:hypothetical protein